jgi:hypothetical protein
MIFHITHFDHFDYLLAISPLGASCSRKPALDIPLRQNRALRLGLNEF